MGSHLCIVLHLSLVGHAAAFSQSFSLQDGSISLDAKSTRRQFGKQAAMILPCGLLIGASKPKEPAVVQAIEVPEKPRDIVITCLVCGVGRGIGESISGNSLARVRVMHDLGIKGIDRNRLISVLCDDRCYWDSRKHGHITLHPGEQIHVGFDGSKGELAFFGAMTGATMLSMGSHIFERDRQHVDFYLKNVDGTIEMTRRY